MVIKTNKFKFNEKGKLDVNLKHNYYPFKDEEEYKDIYVVCEHLKNSEKASYLNMQNRSFDFERLFEDKVLEIHGISIEDATGKTMGVTVKDVISIPYEFFEKLIVSVATHLIEGLSLNEDEVKN